MDIRHSLAATIGVVALIISSPTWATNKGNDSGPEASSEALAASSSSAIAAGVGVGIGGRSDAIADAVGIGGNSESNAIGLGGRGGSADAQAMGGTVESDIRNGVDVDTHNSNGAESSNEGNELNTSFSSSDRAYALGLAPATAAPLSNSDCVADQTAGWNLNIAARTGRNKYLEGCADRVLAEKIAQAAFARCVDVAKLLASWGSITAAAEQLNTCNGARFSTALVPVDRQREERERQDRIFQALQSK